MPTKRKSKAGRKPSDDPKNYRVMIRLSASEGEALEKHCHNIGAGGVATVARMAVIKELMSVGLVKPINGGTSHFARAK